LRDQPQARTEGIVAEHVDDDLVIYDQLSQTAHSLSAAAASVWELCDGQLSSEDIAHRLALAPEMVARALEELSTCGLLDEGPVFERGYSRREAGKRIAKIGGAAFAAPLIYSVAIGPAMAAASTPANNNGTAIAPGSCYSSSGLTGSHASGGTIGYAATGTGTNQCTSGRCYEEGTSAAAYCVPSSNTPGAGPSTCQGYFGSCTGTGGCCATCSSPYCT
jgi:hypothetical protein